ncbi:MAG TPA: sulfur carrier protein ThiS [Campylobacterales bacterium]|nr:sulfur carrier protein ThiS [Campylobacterales bacterium]
MEVVVNGKKMEFPKGSTIEDILNKLQIRDKVMATAVNLEVVKKENWKNFTPKDGDRIEFLQFVGGG